MSWRKSLSPVVSMVCMWINFTRLVLTRRLGSWRPRIRAAITTGVMLTTPEEIFLGEVTSPAGDGLAYDMCSHMAIQSSTVQTLAISLVKNANLRTSLDREC
jgi:hypothetical protein